MNRKNVSAVSRRTALRAIGGGLVLATAVGPASARSNQLARELNGVRAATRRYRDVSVARADGYGAVVSPYVPAMGFHLINPGLLAADADEEIDVTEPPILVYYTTGNYDPGPGGFHDPARDDDLRLGAVEYGHLGDDGPPGTPANYFSDENASHNLEVSEEEGWEWTPGPNITALHVWIHRGNPAGVFHPTNPTID